MILRGMRLPISHFSAAVLAAVPLSHASSALASGYSAMPEMREAFPNHADCVVRLRAFAAEHLAQVKPRTMSADGGFQEVTLEKISDGVELRGRRVARYEARVWYHNGRQYDDGGQYEVNHSWDHSNYECQGKALIANIAQGYTLSTFESASPAAP